MPADRNCDSTMQARGPRWANITLHDCTSVFARPCYGRLCSGQPSRAKPGYSANRRFPSDEPLRQGRNRSRVPTKLLRQFRPIIRHGDTRTQNLESHSSSLHTCKQSTEKRKSGDSSPCSTDSEATTDQGQEEWSSIVQIQQSRPQWLVGRLDQPSRARAATRQPGQLLSLRPRSAKSKGCCQPGADSGRDPRLIASSAARVSVVTSTASG